MFIEAANWRWEREMHTAAWVAWHTAALQRSKRMPPLSRLVSKLRPKRKASGREMAGRRREFEELKQRMG